MVRGLTKSLFFRIIANKTAVKFDCYGNVNVDLSVRLGNFKMFPNNV